MRDYRDAKAMARRLREALAERGLAVSHSDGLELIARSFGLKDWHVLAAMIEAARPDSAPAAPPWSGPALLLRDIVVFPKLTVPVFIGREMSVRAQQRAYEGELEVLLVTQRERSDDSPGADAVYRVGVIADVLDRTASPDGTVKLLVRSRQRASILALTDEAGYRRAEAALVAGIPAPSDFPAPRVLVRDAAAAFEAYAASRQPDRRGDPRLGPRRHPCRGAGRPDRGPHAALPSPAKQAVLETLDPRQRLEKAVRLLGAPDAKAA